MPCLLPLSSGAEGQGSAATEIPKHDLNCSGGCCGCGCGCTRCFCRDRIAMVDSNQGIYGGQGGRGAVQTPNSVDNPTVQSSSLATTSSCDSISQSLNKVNLPITADPTTTKAGFETLRRRHERQSVAELLQRNMERYLQDMDDNPWPHFLEYESTVSNPENDVVLPFEMIELEGSMQNNRAMSRAESSMLSDFMSSLQLQPPSTSISAVLLGAGGVGFTGSETVSI